MTTVRGGPHAARVTSTGSDGSVPGRQSGPSRRRPSTHTRTPASRVTKRHTRWRTRSREVRHRQFRGHSPPPHHRQPGHDRPDDLQGSPLAPLQAQRCPGPPVGLGLPDTRLHRVRQVHTNHRQQHRPPGSRVGLPVWVALPPLSGWRLQTRRTGAPLPARWSARWITLGHAVLVSRWSPRR